MELIWDSGINFTQMVQSAGKWLAPLMQTASLLGTEGFYLIFLLIFYWCIDPSAGRRLMLMLMLSDSVNTFFKLVFHHPRPYWYSTAVTAYGTEGSFGLPSGHAQHSLSIWGTLAVLYRKKLLSAAVAAVILLISISRVYLGVHFYTDILLGWIIGLALLLAAAKFFAPAAERLSSMSLPALLILSVLVSAAVLGMQMAPLFIHQGWAFPEGWKMNIQAAFPGSAVPDPRRMSGIFSVSGAVLGYGAGLALIHKSGGFRAEGPLTQKCLRYAAGLVVAIAIYAGLKLILPHGDSLPAQICRYLRYALTGLWVTWGAPLLFIRMGLAESTEKPGI